MARTDNYLIQAQQAKACFLTYDATMKLFDDWAAEASAE